MSRMMGAANLRCAKSKAGFTLIEVLVALAILAVALGALIRGGSTATANAAHLRDKTFAEWVALNQIAEQQVAPVWPGTGRRTGSSMMANREWQWEQVIEGTEDGDVRRLTVSVTVPGEDGTLVRLLAYLPRPAVN